MERHQALRYEPSSTPWNARVARRRRLATCHRRYRSKQKANRPRWVATGGWPGRGCSRPAFQTCMRSHHRPCRGEHRLRQQRRDRDAHRRSGPCSHGAWDHRGHQPPGIDRDRRRLDRRRRPNCGYGCLFASGCVIRWSGGLQPSWRAVAEAAPGVADMEVPR